MLGHSKIQGDVANVFRLLPSPVSPVEEMYEPLLMYLSRYESLIALVRVVGRGNLFNFLDIFCGQQIKVPKLSDFDAGDDCLTYTLLPEVALVFGDHVLERFISEFAGKVVKIPPSQIVRSSVRDVDVYLQMRSRRVSTVGKLAAHYGVSKAEVWWLYRRVAQSLGTLYEEEELRKAYAEDSEEPAYVG